VAGGSWRTALEAGGEIRTPNNLFVWGFRPVSDMNSENDDDGGHL